MITLHVDDAPIVLLTSLLVQQKARGPFSDRFLYSLVVSRARVRQSRGRQRLGFALIS